MTTTMRLEQSAIHASLIEQAKDAGYRTHQGGAEDPPELQGKWWWSWSDNGRGIETSPGEWDTEAEAWAGAIVAHANDLMEP